MKRFGNALEELAARYDLGAEVARFAALLQALAAEADPPTTVRDPPAAVDHHLADSLVALEVPAVRTSRHIADVGAGAGFPGLPLALALPNASVDLIEGSRRKCEVIERLAAASAATNARAISERAETWAAEGGSVAYDVVTARAVAPLSVLAEYAAPLLRRGGSFVAWKGRRDPGEEDAGAVAAERLGLAPAGVLHVAPFAGARERHLHVFTKRAPTPPGFPRRPGRAAKRPLA